MTIRDLNLIYSKAQAVLLVGDTASANCFDAGSALASDIGHAVDDVFLSVVCNTAATSSGSATLRAVLQDSADGVNFSDVIAGPVLPVAQVARGVALLQIPFPTRLRRFTQVVYRVGTAPLTAGKFDAFVSIGVQRNVAQKSGFFVA
ncbi:MAG: hypothetical protein PHI64_07990 [Zoogloea sp.]|uniref:Bbp16 family capsid cement protein n=1 Tax=Zoogloea sp. TaxID=49181 RepID=UPI002625F1F6|nr:hypothetical protein [Zoogloea sp.]MDD2988886.1 hypothetical protein [Zoogloea sp.]